MMMFSMHLVVQSFTENIEMVLTIDVQWMTILDVMAGGSGVGISRCAAGILAGGTHVDGGNDGDGLLGDVHPGKDGGGLADAWQPLRQQLRGQVAQVQVEVVLPSGNALFLERHMRDSMSRYL